MGYNFLTLISISLLALLFIIFFFIRAFLQNSPKKRGDFPEVYLVSQSLVDKKQQPFPENKTSLDVLSPSWKWPLN